VSTFAVRQRFGWACPQCWGQALEMVRRTERDNRGGSASNRMKTNKIK
jgi:hypothetical protein